MPSTTRGLDADRQPHADEDPGDDEHDQPNQGGQPDKDAEDQDGAEPGEAEAVALLNAEVLAATSVAMVW